MSDAKLFLKRIEIYNAIIESKLEEIASLEAMVTRITPVLKDTPGGNADSGRKLENAIIRIAELKNQLADVINQYIDLKENAMKKIDTLEAKQLKILYERYFKCKSWQEIADEMDMSIRNVCNLHGKAIQQVDNLMKQINEHEK